MWMSCAARLRASPRREGFGMLTVIARLDRAIQYSETVVMEQMGRGVLDAPPSRGMTAEIGA